MTLNNKVVVPKYFWKAICDPISWSSVVFFAENPDGNKIESIDTKKIKGCDVGSSGHITFQTVKKGVLFCNSVDNLRSSFNLPPFSQNCKPYERRTFLDEYLEWSLE